MRLSKRNSIQKTIVFISLVVFIAANVGMAVFTHKCSIAGVEKSFFKNSEDACSTETEVKTCCSKPTTKEVDPCCSTETDYVSLDIDLRIDKVNFVFDFVFLPFEEIIQPKFYFDEFTIATNNLRFEQLDLPPPKHQGRNFQSIHQVFLI